MRFDPELLGMRVRLETYGCAMNRADSEIIAALLSEGCYEVDERISVEEADVVVVNTCTVKTPTERKMLRRLKELESSRKKVVVAGCLPAADPSVAENFRTFSFIGTNTSAVVRAVEALLSGKRLVELGRGECRLDKPKARFNPVVEILPISQGCVGNCSYCIVRLARGELSSYPRSKVVRRAKKALEEGVKEVWLTSQDTGAYGLDRGALELPQLLEELSSVEGKFRIRVGMMNPNHAARMLDELLEAYSSEKVYKFLHLPLQSGNDGVLRDMRRAYDVETFLEVVRAFKEAYPELTLATDVIVGFPTEDEEAFLDTVKVIKRVEPDIVNVSRYWPRPHTEAAKLKQLPGHVTKRRSRIMNEVFREIAERRNERWLGWRGEALVSETATNAYCARNFAYKPIIVMGSELLGRFVEVEVVEHTYYDLRARLL